MKLTRRRLAGAGALALAMSGLLQNTSAALGESAEDAVVGQAVEALRKALLTADKGQLEKAYGAAAELRPFGRQGSG